MKRGHRKLWRAVAESSAKVAASKNFAEEYIYGAEFSRSLHELYAAAAASRAEREAEQASSERVS